ncbi:DEAD/DEAH box helicase [Clostridioides difficile]
MEKLKLKKVSDIIREDYKKWTQGDVVLIDAQTGTGKTYFINSVLAKTYPNKKILYICNRIHLKSQIKKDLLENFLKINPKDGLKTIKEVNKKFNKSISDNKIVNQKDFAFENIDLIDTLGNIKIQSYQSLSNVIINNRFFNEDEYFNSYFSSYDYIVFDECHYLYSDANFNNKTYFIFDEIFNKQPSSAIKIFMSATIDNLKAHIDNIFKTDNQKDTHNLSGVRAKLHYKSYRTNRDYSYLDIRYFKTLDALIQKIQNDNTTDKWIIFVSNLKDAKYLKENLKKIKTVIIKQGTKNKEVDSIINESKFNSKVLISTKVLDNGINIKDENVKNIVIMALDKTTFLQELGRVRVNIDTPYKINLFIPMKNQKTFITLKNKVYMPKESQINLFFNEHEKFTRIYNIEFNKLHSDLFYLDKIYQNKIVKKYDKNNKPIYKIKGYDKNNKPIYNYANYSIWKYNPVGLDKLAFDSAFTDYIIKKFDDEGDFAFIKEQLSWLELSHTFDENNLLDGINNLDANFNIEEKISELENFLINNLTIDKKNKNKLEEDKKKKLSQMINELKSINNKNSYKSTICQVKTVNDFLASNPYKKLHYSIISHRVCKNLKSKNGESPKSKNYTYWEVVTKPTKQASKCSLEGF